MIIQSNQNLIPYFQDQGLFLTPDIDFTGTNQRDNFQITQKKPLPERSKSRYYIDKNNNSSTYNEKQRLEFLGNIHLGIFIDIYA